MKLKSLLLGSVAAAGLSTSAFAADLSTVVSSFDVCEDLGISGTLQLASTDDCLQISGEVKYEFKWGDYAGNQPLTQGVVFDGARRTVMDNNWFLGNGGTVLVSTGGGAAPAAGLAVAPGTLLGSGALAQLDGAGGAYGDRNANGIKDANEVAFDDLNGNGTQELNEPSLIATGTPAAAAAANTALNMDWYSEVETWVQFVGSASSEFGTAKAVIKLFTEEKQEVKNEVVTTAGSNAVTIKEAYVSVGDGTSIVAGRRDTSVFKEDDDEPFGFIGLFHSDAVDKGVGVMKDHLKLKGHVIQLYHAVGDSGVTVSAGLENINNSAYPAIAAVAPLSGVPAVTAGPAGGSLVGTIAYAAPDGSLTGHVSAGAGGVLDGTIEEWKMHAGFTGTFDNFKVRGAAAGGSYSVGGTTVTEWNGLVSAEATFDMFTLAAALEAANYARTAMPTVTQWGGSVTASAAVTDMVTLEGGFRWYDSNTAVANTETWQAALRLIAKLTDTLTATLEGGMYDTNFVGGANDVLYGSAEVAWKPGGQFETSLKGEVNSIGAYKATFKASKKFD